MKAMEKAEAYSILISILTTERLAELGLSQREENALLIAVAALEPKSPNVETPNITEVCQMFDLQVLTDLSAKGNRGKARPVFSLGDQAELAAGLRGGSVTPAFSSMRRLEGFCHRNLEAFRQLLVEGASTVDATEW